MGDDDTLPIRFRSHDLRQNLKLTEESPAGVADDLRISVVDSDDEFKVLY